MEAAGFVLAGGRSSRLGRDKALLVFEGETLLARALRKLREVCPDVAIAGGAAGLERFGRVIPDEMAGCGPLAGIVAALRQSEREWNLFIPVDVPLLPVQALRALLLSADGGAGTVVAAVDGRVHPLCAVIARTSLPGLERKLAAGAFKVQEALEASGPVTLWEAAERGWFLNVNTPADLAMLASAEHGDRWGEGVLS